MHVETAVLCESGEALARVAEDAAAFVMRRYHETRPELMQQFDSTAIEAVERDVRHHLEFLVQALSTGRPELFDDYVAWAATLFAGLGLPEEWLTESLQFVEIASRALLEERQADAVERVVRAAVERMPERGYSPPPFVMAEGPAGPLAVGYLNAVLSGDHDGATRMMVDAVEDGMPLEVVYLQVIAPVQADVGRLWLTGQITVAREHLATAVTLDVLDTLSAFRKAGARVDRKVLTACIGDERHAVGARIVSDFFDLGGWEARFLGTGASLEAILEVVEVYRPDVVALSVTMAPHLADLRVALDAIRHTGQGANVKVLVGGRPFNVAPGLWRAFGADGWAPDAAGAVRTAASLVRV